MERDARRWSGYIPLACIVVLVGVAAFVAARLGLPFWAVVLPAAVAAYFISRTLLRHIYSKDG